MNEWIQRSIELVNSPGYLDKLHEVYPVSRQATREIDPDIRHQLREVYNSRNALELARTLLRLDRFPTKDPYVAFLRKKPFFAEYNPRTVERIARELYAMGFEKMIEGIEKPVEFNRQIGVLFKRWLPTVGYPLLQEGDFTFHQGRAFLSGSNGALMRYANAILHCQLSKGPDFLAKAGSQHILGEAKFLTAVGGHQNAQFTDALSLLRGTEGNAIRVAVLDGVVWIRGNTRMYRTVCSLDREIALSSLLLKDFLDSLF